jgi:Right handed beta helix region
MIISMTRRGIKAGKINSLVIYLVFFGLGGSLLLLAVRAASGPFVVFEPDTNLFTGNSAKLSAQNSFGGEYLRFGGLYGQAYEVPAYIARDCSFDVSEELNTWLDSLPNSATINFPSGGCFLAENAIKIDNKESWVVNGNGASLHRTIYNDTAANMRHLHLSNVSNFSVNNLTIVGQKEPSGGYAVAVEGQHGVGIYGGQNITIDNLNISHVHGDFVYVNRYQGTSATNVTIKNSIMTDSGRQGVAIIDGETILVQGNNITNSNRYMIDLEPGGAGQNNINNVTFDGNTFSGGGLGFLAGEGAGGGISNLVLSNNTLTGPMTILIDPPSGFRRGPITIRGNTSSKGAARDLILLHNIDGIVIENNQLMVKPNAQGNPVHALVHLFDTTDTRVINNTTVDALVTIEAEASASGYCESANTPNSPGVPACL